MVVKGQERTVSSYGRSRRRRVVLLLILLFFLLAALPYLLKAPDVMLRVAYPLKYEEMIRSAAAENDVEPALVAAVVRTESGFDPNVESSQGAYGLMQIRAETASFISARGDFTGDYRDPNTNIRMGTWYLSYLQNRYGSDERLTLAAYNSGEGQVDEWTREGWNLDKDIPFKETQEYVNSVLEARDTYTELYGSNLDRRPG